MRQPFMKGASSGRWGLVIVIHPEAFPGGKHGPVFPDQTWTLLPRSQTHCLACTNISPSHWTAHPGGGVLLLYFTNVCVFSPASLGKPPCATATCHWQGISHQDGNLGPSPKLPILGVAEPALEKTVVLAFFLAVRHKNSLSHKRLACSKLIRRAVSEKSDVFYLGLFFFNFWILHFPTECSLPYIFSHISSKKISTPDDDTHLLLHPFSSLALFACLKLLSQHFSLFTSLAYCILNVPKSLNLQSKPTLS